MPIFTARSEFTEQTMTREGFNCNGCREPVVIGRQVFVKPYIDKHNKPCHVYLHNLDECWETFDDRVWQDKARKRKLGIHPKRRRKYAQVASEQKG